MDGREDFAAIARELKTDRHTVKNIKNRIQAGKPILGLKKGRNKILGDTFKEIIEKYFDEIENVGNNINDLL